MYPQELWREVLLLRSIFGFERWRHGASAYYAAQVELHILLRSTETVAVHPLMLRLFTLVKRILSISMAIVHCVVRVEIRYRYDLALDNDV